jgi:hypothetical protein
MCWYSFIKQLSKQTYVVKIMKFCSFVPTRCHVPETTTLIVAAVKPVSFLCSQFIRVLKIVLWHVDPFLGNDLERSSYTTAVTEQRLRKQACLQGNDWKQQQRNGVFCAVLAEMLWAGQLEEWSQLSEWVRGQLRFSRCAKPIAEGGYFGTKRKGMSTVGSCYRATATEDVTVDTSVCVCVCV